MSCTICHFFLNAVITADLTWRLGAHNCELQTYYCVHTHGKQGDIKWADTNYIIDSNTTGFAMFRHENQITIVLNTTEYEGKTLRCSVSGITQEFEELLISKQATPDIILTYMQIHLCDQYTKMVTQVYR